MHTTKCYRRLLTATAVTGTLALAACQSSSSNADGTGAKTITIAMNAEPASLDPALSQSTAEALTYIDLAYEPLITQDGNGALSPGLATSWKYTNKALTTFQLTLRPDAKFSDGQPVTAADVVKSVDRDKTANGVIATTYADLIKSATATGSDTVTLDLSKPDPVIAQLLTQEFLVGAIVGPQGLADPKSLGTATDGAGPYMLDAAQTVAGQHYTYVPNPYYWDKSAVHFTQFTVDVIPNPQTAYNALRSGQVSFIDGSPDTISQASGNSSLAVYSAPAAWYGVDLIDRSGALVPALAKQQVREALNYAVNRAAVTQTLFDGYGIPTDEISDSAYAGDGYDPSYTAHYTYDPAKAKQLLAQAGYPNGFTLTIDAAATFGDGVEVSQAIASYWAAIGVKAQIDDTPDSSVYVGLLVAKKVPALAFDYGVQPMFLESTDLLNQGGGLFNAFGSTDPELSRLLATARAATTPAAESADWAAVEQRVVDLGWFVPVAIGAEQFYGAKSLQGVDISAENSSPDPVEFHF
jgi:peptide/nickel transport system substrate-binding protein